MILGKFCQAWLAYRGEVYNAEEKAALVESRGGGSILILDGCKSRARSIGSGHDSFRNISVQDDLRPSVCGEELKKVHVITWETAHGHMRFVIVGGFMDNADVVSLCKTDGFDPLDLAYREPAFFWE